MPKKCLALTLDTTIRYELVSTRPFRCTFYSRMGSSQYTCITHVLLGFILPNIIRATSHDIPSFRCITNAYGTMGCSRDVLSHMDAKCSGRQSCVGPVGSVIPLTVQPCPGDFRSYLEASYICAKGNTWGRWK